MRVYLKFDLSAQLRQNRLPLTIGEAGNGQEAARVSDLYNRIEEVYGLTSNEYVVVSEVGVSLHKDKMIEDSQTFAILPTVLGGKGGFGSLIRSFGKQIAKSTNKDACRDLTGRRIRHVNEEKKIKEYINKQSEIARQKEEEKKERIERRRKKRDYLENGARAQFLDPEYVKQMEKINEDVNQAVKAATGSQKRKKSSEEEDDEDDEKETTKATTSAQAASKTEQTSKEEKPCSSAQAESKASASAVKSKATASKPITKNLKGWLGVDAEVSSSEDDEDEEEEPVVSKKSKKC